MNKQIHSEDANENHSPLRYKLGNSARPKHAWKRGVCFLIGGLVGGTVLVVVLGLVLDDWPHLKRWLSGLAVVAIVAACVFGKKWLLGRAVDLTGQHVDPISRTGDRDG